MKTKLICETFEEYAKRASARAAKLSRGEKIPAKRVISFESWADFYQVVTEQRIRLCEEARKQSYSVSGLAVALKRDPRSVRRDVKELERLGVVRTREVSNPGHGRIKIVVPVAKRIQLRASVFSRRVMRPSSNKIREICV